MSTASETHVYKILSPEDWHVAKAIGYTRTDLDEGDGYVHLSTREQVGETLALHYAGRSDVRLLEYALEDLGPDLRWEESRGGQLFPHLYGRLRVSLAEQIWTLASDHDGNPKLPDDLGA